MLCTEVKISTERGGESKWKGHEVEKGKVLAFIFFFTSCTAESSNKGEGVGVTHRKTRVDIDVGYNAKKKQSIISIF